ncbi:hypothetical protein ANSO36C_41380 [Nostoc cf. commune SO-36]|uniref:Uncharacterized protein n=1 Tax=Nostoc cf. commune SO-36 TaxID=449208 RepID=A0ABN6Q511_NOSCO|nr:hypothetical protein ANSO36C_41380 [Nostoc cf. commune SO-36]
MQSKLYVKEAAFAGEKTEDDITTAVAAKKDGTAEVEKRFFMLIDKLNRMVRLRC